jgi:hypothetical protein
VALPLAAARVPQQGGALLRPSVFVALTPTWRAA